MAAVAAFTIGRLLAAGGPTLATLEQMSVPLEVALANGKPTVMEFYADWWVDVPEAAGGTRFVNGSCWVLLERMQSVLPAGRRCEVCQSLVAEEYRVEQAYRSRYRQFACVHTSPTLTCPEVLSTV